MGEADVFSCDNCDWSGPEDALKPIQDFWERIEAGGIVPAGQCPRCGALAYPVNGPTGNPPRVAS